MEFDLDLSNGVVTLYDGEQETTMSPKIFISGWMNESLNISDELLEGKFSEWEVSFKAMNLSGTKLSPKNVYKVKARGTGEAIRKAAKEAGVKDDHVDRY